MTPHLSRNLYSVRPIGDLSSEEVPNLQDAEEEFRRRLAEAVARVGRKSVTRHPGDRSEEGGKISEGGLSKILNGERENPGIFTVKQIAEDAGVTVGQLLGEKGFELQTADLEFMAQIITWARNKIGSGVVESAHTQSDIRQPHRPSTAPAKPRDVNPLTRVLLGGKAVPGEPIAPEPAKRERRQHERRKPHDPRKAR